MDPAKTAINIAVPGSLCDDVDDPSTTETPTAATLDR